MERWLRNAGFWPLAAIAFTGTLVMALGTPPDGAPVLVWLGFLPLTLVARVHRGRLRGTFALGWIGGLCAGLVGFPWIAETLERFGGFPPWLAFFGLFVFSAWTALPFGVWVVAVRRGPSEGVARTVWPVVAWVALAAIWPSLFPYTVAIGFALEPAWMQAAELGGVALVEAQVVLAGVLLADGILDAGRRSHQARIVVALAIPAVSFGLGTWRIAALDAAAEDAPVVRFGIVQPNTPLLDRRGYDKMNRLRQQSRRAQDEGAQIIVWPEAGAYPYVARRPLERDFSDSARKVLYHHDAPTIFGLATRDPPDPYEYNTVAALASDGRVTGTFDKVNLVPFGEYIPIVDPDWARSLIPAMSHNNAGDGPARFVLEPRPRPGEPAPAPIAAGPLICYEDIFPEFAREVAAQAGGLEVFVNVTIDTWFGDTAEPWEHLALAQFRSVEHRIPMLRSVAAGASSVVDHAGRLQAALPVRAPTLERPVPPERLVVDVKLPRNTEARPTVFARFGWLLRWLCVAAFGGVVLAHLGKTGIKSVRK